MDKKIFNKITKDVFMKYGFLKEKSYYILKLEDVTLVVKFCSWRGVKSFDYYFYINELYDDSIPFEQKGDTLFITQMEHSLDKEGYHRHEILYENYSEEEYTHLLDNMLHRYFDPFKDNALQFLKENGYRMCLSKKAIQFIGLV